MTEIDPLFSSNRKSRGGFTLVEILLAMMVFAIAITTILALLARTIESVGEVVLKDEAMRLCPALEAKLRSMPFDEVYNLVQPTVGTSSKAAIYAYFYRGKPNTTRSDGSLVPETDGRGTPGVDFVVTPGVRLIGGSELKEDIAAKNGTVFRVNLEVPDQFATVPFPAGNPDAYNSAVIVLYAEFYPDYRNINISGVNFGSQPAGSKVAFAYNFAVRR